MGNEIKYEMSMKLDYLDIGGNANFHINDEFSINIGPYLGVLLGDKGVSKQTYLGVSNSDTFDVDASSIDFGVNLGFSYWVNDLLQIDARYGLGLISLDDSDDPDDVFNRTIQLGVGYLFAY